MVAERGLQGQWEGVFIVDLIIFVNCFKFSPSVLSGKGMPAHGKKNSNCEVVGTPRIFHNKGTQRFRRLALHGDPLPESPALKDSSASGAGCLVCHMGDKRVRLACALKGGTRGESWAHAWGLACTLCRKGG